MTSVGILILKYSMSIARVLMKVELYEKWQGVTFIVVLDRATGQNKLLGNLHNQFNLVTKIRSGQNILSF